MQAYMIHLIAHVDPIKYVPSKPIILGWLARWGLLLTEYEIICIPQKAIKRQTLADLLENHLISTAWEILDDLPDREIFYIDIFPSWMMFFDGSTHYDVKGAGVVFVSPQRHILPYSFVLSEWCSNITEYQALIIGLQMVIKMKITSLEICGDSKLVINQLLALYEVKSDDLVPYFQYATQLMEKFEQIFLVHIPRKENQMENALTNLAPSLTLFKDKTVHVPLCHRWVLLPLPILQEENVNVISIFTIDSEDWQ